jgi:REP element-mobilizing transposase RayT
MNKTLQDFRPLQDSSRFFHIIQHANGDDVLFQEERNYEFFLGKMKKILLPKSNVLAYCLMQNHLHLLIQPKHEAKESFQALSNLFNSYAKSFNILYKRKGSLFIKHNKQIPLLKKEDIKRTIMYIHRNPIHHHSTSHYHAYKWSSYNDVLNNNIDFITSDKVLPYFGNKDDYIKAHEDFKYAQNLQGCLPDRQGLI